MSGFNEGIIAEFRASGGFVVTGGFGDSLLLVHHVGARTGAAHITPAVALPRPDGGWEIAASAGGAPTHPSWYFNLRAHPETVVEAPGQGVVAVRARVLEGAERDAAWARFLGIGPGFAWYEQNAGRTIPVVRLTRRAA